jgi:hypothetical protein
VGKGRRITWEDAEYRIDFAGAERSRLGRVRSRTAEAWLDAALAALDLADRLGGTASPSGEIADRVLEINTAARLDVPQRRDDYFGAYAWAAAASVSRQLERGDRGSRLAARDELHDLADALGAMALIEVTYAVNMGWAESLPLKAESVARRHRFFLASHRAPHQRDLSWSPPQIKTDTGEPWHVRGGLIGLDVGLAPVTLRRLSMRMPAAPPTLTESSRELLTTTTVLLDRRSFSDEGQQQLVMWLARGRARVAGAADPLAVESIAADAQLSPLRAGIARWLAETDPPALNGFFSTTELLRVGLEGRPVPSSLNGWGNRETPLSGRDTCGLLPALSWERYASRWNSGLLAYAVPDLQLALASALATLDLPAVLVPDLMAPATLDFVTSVPTRHPDDWRAMVDWTAGLTTDTIERYLGILTTDGPLRVVDQPRVTER